jgi:putative transposase
VRAALAGRTRELERLAVELYARGLSTRDIEDAFTDETGRRLLSRAAVSEITERLWAEYEDFCKRDLSEHAVVYLFVDGIAERFGQASGVRLCWLPGASARTDARSSWG